MVVSISTFVARIEKMFAEVAAKDSLPQDAALFQLATSRP